MISGSQAREDSARSGADYEPFWANSISRRAYLPLTAIYPTCGGLERPMGAGGPRLRRIPLFVDVEKSLDLYYTGDPEVYPVKFDPPWGVQ